MAEPRYVLVTGASTGIGRATAVRLARSGMHVFAGVRKDEDARSIQQEGIAALTPLHVDVTDLDSIDEALSEVAGQVSGAGLYGLVNNAGVALGGPMEFTDRDTWQRQFNVNVIGTTSMVQRSLPLLRKAENARIVNVGSIAGLIYAPLIAPYSASKHAIEAITGALRVELAAKSAQQW